MVATSLFIMMPPSVLPAATTLKTVPSEWCGTRSTTSALMLMSHASEATTVTAASTSAPLTSGASVMSAESGIRQAQTSITRMRLSAAARPRRIRRPEYQPPARLPAPAAA